MKRVIVLAIVMALFSGAVFAAAKAVTAKEETPAPATKEELAQVEKKLQEVSDALSQLSRLSGVRINGEIKFSTTDLLFMGPGAGVASGSGSDSSVNYKPMTQYIDLKFASSLGEVMNLTGVFRFENVMGGYWGSYSMYGVRKITVDGVTPFADYAVGDYSAKLTELTLAPSEETRLNAFESDIFASRKAEAKKDLYMDADAWPLSGLYAAKKFDFAGTGLDAGYTLIGAFIGRAGAYNTKTYSAEYDAVVPDLFKHDRFLVAAAPSFGAGEAVQLKINAVKIFDVKKSGSAGDAAIDNTVLSADLKSSLLDGMIKAKGEFAYSVYDPAVGWKKGYENITGIAYTAGAEFTLKELAGVIPMVQAGAGWSGVERDFISFGAQTRVYDAARNPQFIYTQNNTWNPASDDLNPQGYDFIGGVYPFSKYNNSIVAGKLLGYDKRTELAYPYGAATANRQGFFADAKVEFIKDSSISGFAAMPEEIVAVVEMVNTYTAAAVNKRSFMVFGGGIKSKIGDLEVKGGVKMESSENTGKIYPADMDIMSADAGVKYTLFGNLDLMAGGKFMSWKGKEIIAYEGNAEFDGSVLYVGGGAALRVNEWGMVAANYTTAQYADLLDENNNFTAQEIDVNISMKF